jgi:hypothetical protein
MSKKPIRHGLKVFALNCTYTAYTSLLKCTQGKNVYGSPKAVIKSLMMVTGFTFTVHRHGWILYTDNFYTSLEVMHYIYITSGVLMVGMYVLCKKKSQTATNYPFHKLSLSNPLWTKQNESDAKYSQSMYKKGKELPFNIQATSGKTRKRLGSSTITRCPQLMMRWEAYINGPSKEEEDQDLEL